MSNQDLFNLLSEINDLNALLSDRNCIRNNNEQKEIIDRLKNIAKDLLVLQGELWLTTTKNF